MEIRFCFRDTPKRNSVSVSATLRNGIPFPFPRHSKTEFCFRFWITLLYKPQQYEICGNGQTSDVQTTLEEYLSHSAWKGTGTTMGIAAVV